MESQIEIRRAELRDLNSLHKLHCYWIDKKQIKQVFTLEQLEKIVTECDVALAVDNVKVVSYYLLNPFFETGNVEQRKEIIKKLHNEILDFIIFHFFCKRHYLKLVSRN